MDNKIRNNLLPHAENAQDLALKLYNVLKHSSGNPDTEMVLMAIWNMRTLANCMFDAFPAEDVLDIFSKMESQLKASLPTNGKTHAT